MHTSLHVCVLSSAVFGWLNGTELAIEEQSTAIAVAAGFIKGAEFQQFTQQDRRGQLRFITTVVPGTASR